MRSVLDDGLTYYEYGLLDRVTSVKTPSVGYYEYTPGGRLDYDYDAEGKQ